MPHRSHSQCLVASFLAVGGKLVSRVNARSCPLTGLTFARFSQPRAKLIFAANPVVAMHHDKPTLMVRIPAGLQTSVEPSRPPQCLRCCGRFSPRVAA